VGYGRRFVAASPTRIATVPIGYGDGWRRALTNNADVVIGGRRFPLVGTVSMDNITVDSARTAAACGPGTRWSSSATGSRRRRSPPASTP
jgi:alanine racemase